MSCQQVPRSDIRRHGAGSNRLCRQLLELKLGESLPVDCYTTGLSCLAMVLVIGPVMGCSVGS